MSTLLDDIQDDVEEAQRIKDEKQAERALYETKRKAERVGRENTQLREQVEALTRELDFITSIERATVEPPDWIRQKPTGSHQGIVSLVLSDTHYDEVVLPEQVDFMNAYNRDIAEMRTKTAFEKSISLARDYVKGIKYDGAVLFMTGDIFSGNIHEELKETNVGTLYEAVVYWVEPLVAGIKMLASDFKHLVVPAVVGNHGRSTRKPRAKHRAQDNIEWLMYKVLEREFKGDKRVDFMISEASDILVPIYDTNFLATHGDQFRGGSGISGAMAPLLLGQHRKTRRQMAADKPFDWLVMGHFHQYFSGKGLIVSGTMKGYDEFAYVSNFEPEPPKLAWWVTTPEHGVTLSAPVLPADRAAEGW